VKRVWNLVEFELSVTDMKSGVSLKNADGRFCSEVFSS